MSSRCFVFCALLLLGCRSVPSTPDPGKPTPKASSESKPASISGVTPVTPPTSLAASAPAPLAASAPTSLAAPSPATQPEPPVYLLPVTVKEKTVKQAQDKRQSEDTTEVRLSGFSVKMRDKALEKKINAKVAMPQKPGKEDGLVLYERGCEVGVATELVISWYCSTGGYSTDRVGQPVLRTTTYNYLIVDGKLKELALKDLLLPDKAEELLKLAPYAISESCFLIEPEGLSFCSSDPSGNQTDVGSDGPKYEEFEGLMKPGGPLSLVRRATEAPEGYFKSK